MRASAAITVVLSVALAVGAQDKNEPPNTSSAAQCCHGPCGSAACFPVSTWCSKSTDNCKQCEGTYCLSSPRRDEPAHESGGGEEGEHKAERRGEEGEGGEEESAEEENTRSEDYYATSNTGGQVVFWCSFGTLIFMVFISTAIQRAKKIKQDAWWKKQKKNEEQLRGFSSIAAANQESSEKKTEKPPHDSEENYPRWVLAWVYFRRRIGRNGDAKPPAGLLTSGELAGLQLLESLNELLVGIAATGFKILFAWLTSEIILDICDLLYKIQNGGANACPEEEEEGTPVIGFGEEQKTCRLAGEEEEYSWNALWGAWTFAIIMVLAFYLLIRFWQARLLKGKGPHQFTQWMLLSFGHTVGFRWVGILEKVFGAHSTVRALGFHDFFPKENIGMVTFPTVYYGNFWYNWGRPTGHLSTTWGVPGQPGPQGDAPGPGHQTLLGTFAVDPETGQPSKDITKLKASTLRYQVATQAAGVFGITPIVVATKILSTADEHTPELLKLTREYLDDVTKLSESSTYKNTTAFDLMTSTQCAMTDKQYCTYAGVRNQFLEAGTSFVGENCTFDHRTASPQCKFDGPVFPVQNIFWHDDNQPESEFGLRLGNSLAVMVIGTLLFLLLATAFWAILFYLRNRKGKESESPDDNLRDSRAERDLRESMRKETEFEGDEEDKEAEENVADILADSVGLAMGDFWAGWLYWCIICLLLWVFPSGSTLLGVEGLGIGDSNALGTFGPSCDKALAVGTALTLFVGVPVAARIARRLRAFFDLWQRWFDDRYATRVAQIGVFRSVSRIANNLKLVLKVAITWSLGTLLFHTLSVLRWEWFTKHSERWNSWCNYGYTTLTPGFPQNYKTVDQIFNDDVVSCFGFLLFMHAFQLLIVAKSHLSKKMALSELAVLKEMEGTLDKSDLSIQGKEFRPMSREVWLTAYPGKEDEFDRFDINNDGVLSQAEWDQLSDMQTDFAQMDGDHSGFVSRSEWVLAHPEMEEHFDMCDIDKDGSIGADEFFKMKASINKFKRAVLRANTEKYGGAHQDNPDAHLELHLREEDFESQFREGKRAKYRAEFDYYTITHDDRVRLQDFLFIESITERFYQIAGWGKEGEEEDDDETNEQHSFTKEQFISYWEEKGDTEAKAEHRFQKMNEDGDEVTTLKEYLKFHSIGMEAKLTKEYLRSVKQFLKETKQDMQDVKEKVAAIKPDFLQSEKQRNSSAVPQALLHRTASMPEDAKTEIEETKKSIASVNKLVRRVVERSGKLKMNEGGENEKAALEERRLFRMERLEVIHRVEEEALDTDVVSEFQEEGSGIAIFNAYESLFEGLVTYIVHVWFIAPTHKEVNCYQTAIYKFYVHLLLWAGTLFCASLFFCVLMERFSSFCGDVGEESENDSENDCTNDDVQETTKISQNGNVDISANPLAEEPTGDTNADAVQNI